MSNAHTPTTRDIRMAYVDSISRNNPNDYGDDRAKEISAEFFRWLTAHEESIREEEREGMAAAEQRGAAKGWDRGFYESQHHDHVWEEDPPNPYRADRLECDDDTQA